MLPSSKPFFLFYYCYRIFIIIVCYFIIIVIKYLLFLLYLDNSIPRANFFKAL